MKCLFIVYQKNASHYPKNAIPVDSLEIFAMEHPSPGKSGSYSERSSNGAWLSQRQAFF
jgi:hypothetical protein